MCKTMLGMYEEKSVKWVTLCLTAQRLSDKLECIRVAPQPMGLTDWPVAKQVDLKATRI
jgi:hypothetical protein